MVVESCDDLIAKENGDLKQEEESLIKDLTILKSKSIIQPSRDKHEDMVKYEIKAMCERICKYGREVDGKTSLGVQKI